jgi:hypothetical protein
MDTNIFIGIQEWNKLQDFLVIKKLYTQAEIDNIYKEIVKRENLIYFELMNTIKAMCTKERC